LLDRANSLLKTRSKQNIINAYNSFKTLYVRSILESDKKLKIEALKGLITASKKLDLNYKEYEKELYLLIGNRKLSDYRKKEKKISSGKKTKKTFARLNRVVLEKEKVILYFTKPICKIKRFVLKRGGKYRVIYETEAVWPKNFTKYKMRNGKILKVAQYDKKRIRIVIENSKRFFVKDKIEDKKLTLFFKEKKFFKNKEAHPLVFKRKIVVIDPGHGGKDSGAVGYKRKKEKDIVLSVAKKVYKELKKRGYKVYMTRTKDYFVTLRNRTKMANKKMADIFISIHANAAPRRSKYLSMKGVETFFLSQAKSKRAKRVAAIENKADMGSLSYFSKQTFLNFLNREKIIASNKLAIDLHKNILYSLRHHFKDTKDGGVREGPFWVLVGALMPAVLIEIGYITNPTEAKRLSNPYYQKLLARGIADGIDSYFKHNK
jgi:N-acetylmuramoyl-L-alanine amidase